jgi:exodeoxyribonuclease V alpha subunit
MLGLAKDLFKQGAVSLDDFAFSVKTEKPWPTIQQLLESGYLGFVDYSFARAVLNQVKEKDEEQACFLAVMMAFSRLGHLCVSIHDGQVVPSLEALTPHQIEKPFDLQRLEKMVIAGSEKLSVEIIDHGNCPDSFSPLVRDGCNFYLQRNFHFEVLLAEQISRILAFPVQESSLSILSDALNKEQREAVKKGLKSPLMLITGGPGTGKTYTATHFLSAYLKANPGKRIAIAAPTGKAVAHLKRKILEVPELLNQQDQLQVGTLHALLGIKRADDFGDRDFHITADCIIVDECSMIDLALFSALLTAVPLGAKVVLMGDDHQLPPIESGTVFSELCTFAKEAKPSIIAALKVCQRSDQKEILDLSDDIRHGDHVNVNIALKAKHCSALSFYPLAELGKHLSAIDFPEPFSSKPSSEELFSKMDNFRILSPLRKGPYGVEEINRKIWSHYLPKVRSKQYWAIPIIITKTSYQLDLCNGEMGYLVRFVGKKCTDDRLFKSQDYAVFIDKKGSGYREIPVTLLPAFENAYALTVHKSQGSEYNTLLFFLPPGSENFGREVLYTGVTRARNQLILVSQEEIVEKCLAKDSKRNSGLYSRLSLR